MKFSVDQFGELGSNHVRPIEYRNDPEVEHFIIVGLNNLIRRYHLLVEMHGADPLHIDFEGGHRWRNILVLSSVAFGGQQGGRIDSPEGCLSYFSEFIWQVAEIIWIGLTNLILDLSLWFYSLS